MSSIRGKGNKSTELRLRMGLVNAGISGWTIHEDGLPGKPDFYFKKNKVAIFVDGCYWHGCPKCGHIPKTRSEFWSAKIRRNKQRDKNVNKIIRSIGITPIRIWEHEVKNPKNLKIIINKIENILLRRRI